jgi:hypothetical protein
LWTYHDDCGMLTTRTLWTVVDEKCQFCTPAGLALKASSTPGRVLILGAFKFVLEARTIPSAQSYGRNNAIACRI